ncbi:MAG: hypothetical protein IT424_09700 [Pirellulales bacterium]|nr:hypothetical protein [Pirellulales bacterium]
MARQSLMFNDYPVVKFGSITFREVFIILQYDKTPLIKVMYEPTVGYTTSVRAYHQDGTYLATAEGEQLISTPEGRQAGIRLETRGGVTACDLAGKTLFELRRIGADTVKISAEMYGPAGKFIVANDEYFYVEDAHGNNRISGGTMAKMYIAIRVKSRGLEIALGEPPVD